MERGTLNVDTRYNILRRMFLPLNFTFMRVDVYLVSPKFHRAFDANEWLLLPEIQIIDAYYNARHTQKVPKIRVW